MSSATWDNSPPDEAAPPGARPLMPRALGLLLGMAAIFITAEGIQPVRGTLAAAFMALNLVIVVWPIRRILARWIPRFLASVIAGVTAIAALGAMIWSIGWTITRLVQELPKYQGKFVSMIQSIVAFAERQNIDTNLVLDRAIEQVENFNLSTVVSALQGIVSGLGSVVTQVVMILLILVFMVLDSAGFSDRMKRLGERHNASLAWGLDSFARGTRKYWVVTTVFGLIVAGCNWLLLLGLGVPLALIWAVFSFVTNYIPNIGFLIGLVPPVLMALLDDSPLTALWVFVGYCVFNVVIQTFLQPRFTGNAVGITPTMAILSLLLWSYVLGPLGAILAIPATLLMKTLLIDIDPNTRWLNAFIASNPTTSDQDPVRLWDLLERAKRIRALSAIMHRPGVSAEEAEAANRELADLAAEDAQADPPEGPANPEPGRY